MSKHKRTKQEKVIADLRRQLQLQNSYTYSPTKIQTGTHHTSSYATTYQSGIAKGKTYIYHDLYKTALLTSAIIAFELLLFFLDKSHIIKLPVVSF